MAINTTSKEMPTGGCNPTAGAINESNFLTVEQSGKAFETLPAAFALPGFTPHRSDASDGPVIYRIERCGLVRHLPTVHNAALFLVQIGGRV